MVLMTAKETFCSFLGILKSSLFALQLLNQAALNRRLLLGVFCFVLFWF